MRDCQLTKNIYQTSIEGNPTYLILGMGKMILGNVLPLINLTWDKFKWVRISKRISNIDKDNNCVKI